MEIREQAMPSIASVDAIDTRTSKKIQNVSDSEPKIPDAASRGVNGTGSSTEAALQADAMVMLCIDL